MSCETVLRHMDIADIAGLKKVYYSFVDGTSEEQQQSAQVLPNNSRGAEQLKHDQADHGNNTGPSAGLVVWQTDIGIILFIIR